MTSASKNAALRAVSVELKLRSGAFSRWRLGLSALICALGVSNAEADVITVCQDGDCDVPTLAMALSIAQDGDVIEMGPGTFPVIAIPVSGKSIVIRGTRSKNGELLTVIDGQQRPILKCSRIDGPARVELQDLRLTRGFREPYLGYDGGIVVEASTELVAVRCELDNFAGGVIKCSGGAVSLQSCRLRDNIAYRDVAGVSVAYGTLTATDTLFERNQGIYNDGAAQSGALLAVYGNATLERCQFVENLGTYVGAAYFEFAQVAVRECLFSSNVGGNIRAYGGSLTIADSKLLNATYGRGAYLGGLVGSISRSEISGNTVYLLTESAPLVGGAGLSIGACDLDISDCLIRGNIASTSCCSTGVGGVLISPSSGSGHVRISGTSICGNLSPHVWNIAGPWIDLGSNCFSGVCSNEDIDENGEIDMCQKTAGDLNLDGVVSGGDLAVILSNWSDYIQPPVDGDLDGNSFVNAADLALLLSRWTGSQ
jgi:hypothetical protein